MIPVYYSRLSGDPLLSILFEGASPYELRVKANIPLALYLSIISQQLSNKVADVIFARFLSIYGDTEPTPQQVVATDVAELRAIGLSQSKAVYIKNVAQFDIDFGLGIEKLMGMTDEEIYPYVGAIKGIGRWTVHMLLMFSLGREDIFAADDLGVQNGMALLFGLDKTDRKKLRNDIIVLSEQWSPYRTFFVCTYGNG